LIALRKTFYGSGCRFKPVSDWTQDDFRRFGEIYNVEAATAEGLTIGGIATFLFFESIFETGCGDSDGEGGDGGGDGAD